MRERLSPETLRPTLRDLPSAPLGAPLRIIDLRNIFFDAGDTRRLIHEAVATGPARHPLGARRSRDNHHEECHKYGYADGDTVLGHV